MHSWSELSLALQLDFSKKASAIRGSLSSTAAMGLALQAASLSFPAWSQGVAGIPSRIYERPTDSTSGITRAVSTNLGMECPTGSVISGGMCVPLSSLVPEAQCVYGQALMNGVCSPIGQHFPTPMQCPTGFALSGGACVPIPAAGCTGAQPESTQTISCPVGQTGLINQSRSVACTSSGWTAGSWTTTANTCASSAVTASPCEGIPGNHLLTWGIGCQANVSLPTLNHQAMYSILNTNTATHSGRRDYVCSNGVWGVIWDECRSEAQSPAPTTPTPTPTPRNVECGSTQLNWGTYCTATFAGPAIRENGDTPWIANTSAGFEGTARFRCVDVNPLGTGVGQLQLLPGSSCQYIPAPVPQPVPAPATPVCGLTWTQCVSAGQEWNIVGARAKSTTDIYTWIDGVTRSTVDPSPTGTGMYVVKTCGPGTGETVTSAQRYQAFQAACNLPAPPPPAPVGCSSRQIIWQTDNFSMACIAMTGSMVHGQTKWVYEDISGSSNNVKATCSNGTITWSRYTPGVATANGMEYPDGVCSGAFGNN